LPFDGSQDGWWGREGERLRFDGQLIQEHGKTVLHHGMQSQETYTFAAWSGQDVDEVDAVMTYDLIQCDLEVGER
jgi:hypothetical protein